MASIWATVFSDRFGSTPTTIPPTKPPLNIALALADLDNLTAQVDAMKRGLSILRSEIVRLSTASS